MSISKSECYITRMPNKDNWEFGYISLERSENTKNVYVLLGMSSTTLLHYSSVHLLLAFAISLVSMNSLFMLRKNLNDVIYLLKK